jgi:hypothetical protein
MILDDAIERVYALSFSFIFKKESRDKSRI